MLLRPEMTAARRQMWLRGKLAADIDPEVMARATGGAPHLKAVHDAVGEARRPPVVVPRRGIVMPDACAPQPSRQSDSTPPTDADGSAGVKNLLEPPSMLVERWQLAPRSFLCPEEQNGC